MRIAVVNWSRRRIGGTETYLRSVIHKLSELSHDLSFFYERNEPAIREEILLPAGVPSWCVADLGTELAIASLRDWKPDIIYNHSLHDTKLEARMLGIAPSIFFAHTYYGTCISGTKAFKSPMIKPCDRKFGWKCLLHYYPQRCGGLNPVTMLKLYLEQSERLENLRRYNAIVTHSKHMASECIKHGLDASRVYNISYYTHMFKPSPSASRTADPLTSSSPGGQIAATTSGDDKRGSPARLLFLGRMDQLKGGDVLLKALPRAYAMLGRPLHLTFAGDGDERLTWERLARRIEIENPQVKVDFVGWVESEQLGAVFSRCDLLVFPSLWPEPFGLIGLEAGKYGVPVAAFDVGGIPDWLHNEVNGFLASGNPPSPEGLAEAIYKCLQDSTVHTRLRLGAVEVAKEYELEDHLSALMLVFEKVSSSVRDKRI